ncbi:hypothetical protein OROGR_024688 [Orobanche gracilis]
MARLRRDAFPVLSASLPPPSVFSISHAQTHRHQYLTVDRWGSAVRRNCNFE